jgi:glycosyltransferase involved in cell wall biosynthesis
VTSLSVLVPCYNEQYLVGSSLARLRVLEQSPHLDHIEVIVVDDCSRDGTADALVRFRAEEDARPGRKIEWKYLKHDTNQGKGTAVRTALAQATCEISVIHDADLEYHPEDLLRIVEVFVKEKADAVFGSRFAGGNARRVLFYQHQLGNELLTFLSNAVTNLNLTDMETCYKAVRTRLFKSIPLVSNDFRIEPELTIKLAKRKVRIFEVPISYSGRTYQEGKKINWRDGFKALAAIAGFALSDHVYADDEHGSQILARLSRAHTFNRWMADTIRPYVGERVLEIGAGIGNLTQTLIPRHQYVASDINPLYLDTLEGLRQGRPYLRVTYTDVTDGATFPTIKDGFDTVVCLNVVEHVKDDKTALENIRKVLSADGRAIILVPQGDWNFGTLDTVLGHERRYSPESLRAVGEAAGMELEKIVEFNRMGTPAWYLNGKLLGREHFGLGQVLTLNAITPMVRKFDQALPFPSLSLIAIFRPRAGAVTGAHRESDDDKGGARA